MSRNKNPVKLRLGISAVVGLSERSERDQQQTETCFGSGMTFG